MSLVVSDNLVVSMHYKLTDDNGNELDSSKDSEPLSYLHGSGKIIPGLEKALLGKVAGDSLQVKVEPAEGYGVVIPGLIQTVEKSVFKDVESVKVGMIFEARAEDGSVRRLVVKKVDGDNVTIDANHPLAGVGLNFDVNIVDVRKPTKEEVAQGN